MGVLFFFETLSGNRLADGAPASGRRAPKFVVGFPRSAIGRAEPGYEGKSVQNAWTLFSRITGGTRSTLG
jgi:hypothetical protein